MLNEVWKNIQLLRPKMSNSQKKHVLQCFLLISIWLTLIVYKDNNVLNLWNIFPKELSDNHYHTVQILHFFLHINIILTLPHFIFLFLGVICYNTFPEEVKLKIPLTSSSPFLCIRTVSRGDYPEMLKSNVLHNFNVCLKAGLKNFIMEVVIDEGASLDLEHNPLIREILVPKIYEPKSGARFKARALQYCLEDHVNTLKDSDWIVHLDEETIMTENSIKGIINFATDGKHTCGTGFVIFYDNSDGNFQNKIAVVADGSRMLHDMGILRFQSKIFHTNYFGWKGAFIVIRNDVERDVTFDHGLECSVTEDTCFSLFATMKGYTFDFIEGEMYEQSPSLLYDFIQQRKRWLRGLTLIVYNKTIPLRNKFFLILLTYSWKSMPVLAVYDLISKFYKIPVLHIVSCFQAFILTLQLYASIFGIIKRTKLADLTFLQALLLIIRTLYSIPIIIICENLVVLTSYFDMTYQFYVIKKVKSNALKLKSS